ncbi:hypothetical protein DH86_00004209, partial [Scytalidium sp. 3C]
MKGFLSSGLVLAVTLTSTASAFPTFNAVSRDLERRWDAPPLPPCPQGEYTPFTYVGCFDEPSPNTLQYNPNLNTSTMTVETCTATCKSNGFKYAGLIYYHNCLCGTVLPPTKVNDTQCNAPCTGNKTEMCGQNQLLSIYEDPTYPEVDLSTIVS